LDFHSRKGKINKSRLARLSGYKGLKQKPTIVTVNVASVVPFEQIDRSNTRYARRVYRKVNEINMSSPSSTADKIRKTPRQMRIMNLAINRERLRKHDWGYLVDEGTFYIQNEELSPRYKKDNRSRCRFGDCDYYDDDCDYYDDDCDYSDDYGRQVVDRFEYWQPWF